MQRFANVAVLVGFFFVVLFRPFYSTSAQSLPMLRMEPISNGLAAINWPYSNSGFALQEATSLNFGFWQGSTLPAAFNSNTTTFSVLTATTAAAKFFRLAEPVDLRGIYVYVDFETDTNSPAATALIQALNEPGVDGVLLVGLWTNIETNMNAYHWTNLDQWMRIGATLRKKTTISIRAGDGIPAWLYQPPPNGAAATPLNFTVSPKDGKTTNCQPDTIAIPWESAFQTNWNLMLSHLAAHLKSQGTYSNLTMLRLTGINRTSDEFRLPAETPYTNTINGAGLPCVSDAPTIWQMYGYTPSNLASAWSNVIASFNSNFPDKSFCVAIIPYPPQLPFPPIDDTGQIITNVPPDQNQPLLQLAASMLPGRFVVQYNFLMTSNAPNPAVSAAALNYGALTAFQVNNWAAALGGSSGSACGGTVDHPVTCGDASYLNMLQEGIFPLGQTNSLRSQYIEVWATNAVTFTNAIWQAHLQLFQSP